MPFRTEDNEYRLCLLDTGAVSEMVKNETALGRLLSWCMDSEPFYVPCVSAFTLIELRRDTRVFESFVEVFWPFAWMMLKGYDELQEEELSLYPDPSSIDPTSLAFVPEPLGEAGNWIKNLPTILDQPFMLERERYWIDGRQEVLDGMVSLVSNFPPDGDTYSPGEIRSFLEIAVFTQIAERNLDFARGIVDSGQPVQIDAFPTLKTMLYIVFHKFYADRQRKAVLSDVFDLLIASAAPYVAAIVTEANLADTLRKIKRQDGFLGDLEILTLRDIR